MNVLSLFSGIGGLELGLERAGMTTVGQVEIDPFCRSILTRHWPDVPKHDDVRTFPDWWGSEHRPQVDVVCGGFPCQPFSLAGRKEGIADERWGWPWMRDAIIAAEPRHVVIENVSALLRDSDAMGIILGDFANLGFDVEWDVVTACSVGAPHMRRRLFIVADTNRGDRQAGVGARSEEAVPAIHLGPGSWRDRTDWSLEAARVDGRDTDGLPGRMVQALGNAVVPQVAELIGRRVMASAA